MLYEHGMWACFRISMEGSKCLETPNVIEEYNHNMVGVNWADQWLQANSTMVGQHR